MIKIGYFPGCSLHGTGVEYNESLHAIAKVFDIKIEEIKDWNCCGATAAHSLNKSLSVALPARSLALAEKQGFDDILVPCAACYSRLLFARHEFLNDEAIKKEIPELIEMPYTGKCKPINVIDFLEKYILPELKTKVKKSFNLKTACYYGCLLVRPPKIAQVDRYEDPLSMEALIKAIGGEPINWAFKTECCGAGLSVSRTDIVGKLSARILDDAVERGAKAIIVACPMCQSNLDLRRNSINNSAKKNYDIPILFITQAIGMSLGLSNKELGIQRHIVPVNIHLDSIVQKESVNDSKKQEVC